MSKATETTYRVVGLKFDGERETVSTGQNHAKAQEKRLSLLFKKEYPAVVIELEDRPKL